jgi:hypothetical protein
VSSKSPSKALPATLIPGINRIKPAHDRERLKHVKSPDVSKMPYSYHDSKQKYTKYFTTLERKNRFIERLAAMPNNEPLKKGGRTSQTESNQ